VDSEEFKGNLKVVEFAGAAAGTTLNLEPTNTERWAVIAVLGWHDDTGSAQDLSWVIFDENNNIATFEWTPVSRAANVQHPFPMSEVSGQLYVQQNICYLRLKAAGMSSGKKLYAKIFVRAWQY
jgi:hypothetical protein